VNAYTPLPWTKDKHGIYGPDGEKIQVAGVSLVLNGTAAEKAEAEANRDLLFAAPLLLAACECEDAWEVYARGDGPRSSMIEVLTRHGWDSFEPLSSFIVRIRRDAIAAATKGGIAP
jgi:hypothetical protein